MGAACSHKKAGVAKEPHEGQIGVAAGKSADQAPPPSGSAGSTTGGAKAPEPETTVAATAGSPGPAVASSTTAHAVDDFRPGEGTGVYLLQSPETNISLVSQYSKATPSSEQGIILLQVKPPPYIQIPETRFALQGGRRVLKQNVGTMKNSAQAKTRFCEVVMEFIRLAGTYHGFLWQSTRVAEAAQPFSIFYLEQRRKLRAAEDEQEKIGPDAVKEEAPAAGAPTEPARPAAAANEVGGVHEENKQEGEESVPLPADPTGEEVKDSGTKAVDEVEAAGKETAEGEEQKGAEGGPARERDATEGPDTKGGAAKEVDGGPTDDGSKDGGAGAGDDDGLVVCYLKPEGSVSHRLLVNCGVLPLPLDKAKEVIPEFKPVSSPAELQDVVVGNGGFYISDDKPST